MSTTDIKPGDLDAIVAGVVQRYRSHQIRLHDFRDRSNNHAVTHSCPCGWISGVTSTGGSLRPCWAAIDAHLLDVLPDWPRDVCWCGRAVLLSPLGVWFHVEPGSYGHDARVAEVRS